MLLGLAGLLPEKPHQPYLKKLRLEFEHQAHMWRLVPLDPVVWRYSTMYPAGFPDIRLAQLAAVLANLQQGFPQLEDELAMCSHYQAFEWKLDCFWETHYRLLQETAPKPTNCPKGVKNQYMVNVLVPFLYAQALWLGDTAAQKRIADLLLDIPAENNTVTRFWKQTGITARSAFDSQALLELKNEACSRKNCLFCAIGKNVLSR